MQHIFTAVFTVLQTTIQKSRFQFKNYKSTALSSDIILHLKAE